MNSKSRNTIAATELASTLRADSDTSVLITGANGFLGNAVVEFAESNGLTVKTCGRGDNPRKFSDYKKVDLISGDLSQLVAGQHFVIHCAGLAHQFGKKGADPKPFFKVNVQATQRLLQASIKAGVRHFVLVSSVGVYGRNETGKELSEKDNCDPSSPYAESKLEGERQAIAIARKHGIRLTIIRMATIFGEGDRGNISRLMRAIDQRKFVGIGAGENRKSLVYLRDAARSCVVPILEPDKQPSQIEIYNVTAQPIEMREVTNGLASSLNRPRPKNLPTSLVTTVAQAMSLMSFGKGPFSRIEATVNKWLSNDTFSSDKFRKHFGFETEVSLEDGLGRQVAAYREEQPWVARAWFGKRFVDFCLALAATIVFAIPMLIIAALVKFTSKGPVIYWSDRVGKDNKIFSMAKFRSMRTDTPEVATDLLSDAQSWITPVGKFLRKTSLDELPQLWNVLKGDMAVVGSRPPLYNQYTLLATRTARGVHRLRPGLTGWVAVNGRDEVCDTIKVELDRYYCENVSPGLDAKIIWMTLQKVFNREGVKEGSESVDEQPQLLRDGTQFCLITAAESANSVRLAAERLASEGISCKVVGITLADHLGSNLVAQHALDPKRCLFIYRKDSIAGPEANLQFHEFELPSVVYSEKAEEVLELINRESAILVQEAKRTFGPAKTSPQAVPTTA